MEGTPYLSDRVKNFSFRGPWRFEDKAEYQDAKDKLMENITFKLEEGVISHLKALRMKELDKYIMKNCYKNKDYNYLQAEKCDEFHIEKDYKLGLLNSYAKDHLWKHDLDYE